jgi:hypothetical protein
VTPHHDASRGPRADLLAAFPERAALVTEMTRRP